MEHVVTIDNGAPLAFDHRTPLSIARVGMRGPRTQFSPERTVVRLPDTNPEEEESLDGALERQGATIFRSNNIETFVMPPSLGTFSVTLVMESINLDLV